jgi:type II secretory pathway predicted ATPase ExeA
MKKMGPVPNFLMPQFFKEKMRVKARQKKEKEYITNSEKETFLLAKKLAQDFKGQEVVLLTGELGAGKTVFAKGIAAGLLLIL